MVRSARRRLVVTLPWGCLAAWALSVCVLAPTAAAESLPASVAACASEKDVLKRLSCFDREVAPFLKQPAAPSAEGKPAAAAAAAATGAAVAASSSTPTHSGSGEAAKETVPSSGGKPQHVAAHIVRIENFPDEIVVHLDNDDVWQQVDPAPASPNLRAGDAVTIDRSMAAYWLSGPNGVAIKVKQRTKK
jgi:hypothetical protein